METINFGNTDNKNAQFWNITLKYIWWLKENRCSDDSLYKNLWMKEMNEWEKYEC